MKFLFLNDTENWYHFGCTGTSLALKKELSKRGEIIKSYPINALDFQDYIKMIPETDWVIINGEGSLHSPSHFLLDAALLAKHKGKKVAIINASIYPPRNNETYYVNVLKQCDFLGIREHRSSEALKDLDIDHELTFDCLPLYIRENFPSPKMKSKFGALAGSVILRKYLKDPKSDELITDLLGGLNIDEYFFIYGSKEFTAAEDLMYSRVLSDLSHKVVKTISVDDFLTVISQSSEMVSGRFHHSIAAYCLDIPVVIRESNTPKNKALREIFDGKPTLSDLCERAERNFIFL